MPLAPPSTLSPSKLTTFTNCALAFRFVNVDRLPDQPGPAAVRGTLVHRALELLFHRPAPDRCVAAAHDDLATAHAAYRAHPEWVGLDLAAGDEARLVAEAADLVERYFRLEDPRAVQPVGLELELDARVGGVHLRGVVDRLDLVDGELVVTDYKTGRSPDERSARARMLGVHVYSLLVERTFGRRPARVQLLHLAEPESIVAAPTDQSTAGVVRKIRAVWDAIHAACADDTFGARPGHHCSWCSFQRWCPAFGGDPGRAAVDVEIAARVARGQDPLLVV